MRLKRFKKTVASFLTVAMMTTMFPVTAFAENNAAGDVPEDVVSEEDIVVEDEEVTEEVAKDEISDEKDEEQVVEELSIEVEPVESEDEMTEDVEESTIESSNIVNPKIYYNEETGKFYDARTGEEIECDPTPLAPPVLPKGVSVHHSAYWLVDAVASMTENGKPISTPADYSGLGYLLKERFNLKPQVISNDGTLALAGLNASIIQKGDYYYLKLEGCYELLMTAWAVNSKVDRTVGSTIDSPYDSDTKQLTWVSQKNEDIKKEYSDIQEKNTEAPKIDQNTKTVSKDETEYRRSYSSVYYYGTTKIPVKWQVNNNSYYDCRIGSDGKKYIHDELSIQAPPIFSAVDDCYVGTFEYTYLVGCKKQNSKAPTYDEINKIVITEIMNVPVRMYVYSDNSKNDTFYPELIEKVGIVGRQTSGGKTTFQVQLDTNAALGGNYKVTFCSGKTEIVKTIHLYGGKESQTIDVVMDGDKEKLCIVNVQSETFNIHGDDETGYRLKKQIDIPYWTYSIESEALSYEPGTDILDLSTYCQYKLSTPGKYKFTYTYTVGNEKKTMEQECEWKTETGISKIDLKLPANTGEVTLSNVQSPDGLVNYVKKVLYRNEEMMPGIPDEFSATITALPLQKYEGRILVGLQMDYESPKTCCATLHFAYERNGKVEYTTGTLSCKEGYGTAKMMSSDNTTTTNSLDLPNDVTYVKLLYISLPDKQTYAVNQYLYCREHDWGGNCGSQCQICGEIRVTAHDWSKDCTTCSKCGEKRNVEHNLLDTCSMYCKDCHVKARDFEVHKVEDTKNPICIWCKKTVKIGEEACVIPPGMVEMSGVNYYIDETGEILTGWVKSDDNWYYFSDKTGEMLMGWQKINGRWYQFGEDGKMKTSWYKVKNKYYYLGTNGAMVTGWAKVSGVWYYLDASGAMVTGWKKINNQYYFFDKNSGAMVTGWKNENGKWYYMDKKSGAMKTGWFKNTSGDGKWYYFGENGQMYSNKWLHYNGNWYYFIVNGHMVTGDYYIGDWKYKFSSDGKFYDQEKLTIKRY